MDLTKYYRNKNDIIDKYNYWKSKLKSRNKNDYQQALGTYKNVIQSEWYNNRIISADNKPKERWSVIND